LDLFWKPFDARFSKLLERLQSHQALFNSEVQLEESKFVEFQFRRREKDAKITKDMLENIKNQLKELQAENKQKESVLAGQFQKLEPALQNSGFIPPEDGENGTFEPKLRGKKYFNNSLLQD
jgi:hypothetical protein